MSGHDPLGGFFGLDLPESRGGLVRHWGAQHGLGWFNATSALAALIRTLDPPAVWFPAFLCPELAEAAPEARRRFYPLDKALAPDMSALGDLAQGDLVLGVNYFGRDPGPHGALSPRHGRRFISSRIAPRPSTPAPRPGAAGGCSARARSRAFPTAACWCPMARTARCRPAPILRPSRTCRMALRRSLPGWSVRPRTPCGTR